ncbi:Dicer-like protein 1, partial [Gryganskiella cystojenkinii]
MASESTSTATAGSTPMSASTAPAMVLTNETALGVLQSYCNHLAPNTLYPRFIFQEIKNEPSQPGYVCTVQLPPESPVPGTQSTLQPTREIAQVSAVVSACQILSALNQIPNLIIPIEINDDDDDDEQDEPRDLDELHDVIMIDSDDDDDHDMMIIDSDSDSDDDGKFNDGYIYPKDHAIWNVHGTLVETQSYYAYAVTSAAPTTPTSCGLCILSPTPLPVQSKDGSSTLLLPCYQKSIRAFNQQLVLSREQHSVLGQFNTFVFNYVMKRKKRKAGLAAIPYFVAPIELTDNSMVYNFINWDDMRRGNDTELKNHLKKIGFSKVMKAVEAVIAAVKAIAKRNRVKQVTIKMQNNKQSFQERIDHALSSMNLGVRSRKTLNKMLTQSGATREDGISRAIGRVFWKCYRATQLYIHSPFGTAGDLTRAMSHHGAAKKSKTDFYVQLGRALAEGGLDLATPLLDGLQPGFLPTTCWTDLYRNYIQTIAQMNVNIPYLPVAIFPGQEEFEKAFQYKFQNPVHFYMATRFRDSFERYEFLGDAVLDFAVTKHNVLKHPFSHPKAVVMMTVESVRNRTLAVLALEWRMDETMTIYRGSEYERMVEALRADLEEQKKHCGGVGKFWEGLSLPKLLADQVEAIIGAIYVDSGFGMEVVMRIIDEKFAPFMDRHVFPSFKHLFDLKVSAVAPQIAHTSIIPAPTTLPVYATAAGNSLVTPSATLIASSLVSVLPQDKPSGAGSNVTKNLGEPTWQVIAKALSEGRAATSTVAANASTLYRPKPVLPKKPTAGAKTLSASFSLPSILQPATRDARIKKISENGHAPRWALRKARHAASSLKEEHLHQKATLSSSSGTLIESDRVVFMGAAVAKQAAAGARVTGSTLFGEGGGSTKDAPIIIDEDDGDEVMTVATPQVSDSSMKPAAWTNFALSSPLVPSSSSSSSTPFTGAPIPGSESENDVAGAMTLCSMQYTVPVSPIPPATPTVPSPFGKQAVQDKELG